MKKSRLEVKAEIKENFLDTLSRYFGFLGKKTFVDLFQDTVLPS
jgi:hypothetical protein